jgi:putative endonuclease
MMASRNNRAIYTGVTNDLERRVHEHKSKMFPGFTSHYNCVKLVYYEETGDIQAAITREKQIKGGPRRRKVELIAAMNPAWDDLAKDWYG